MVRTEPSLAQVGGSKPPSRIRARTPSSFGSGGAGVSGKSRRARRSFAQDGVRIPGAPTSADLGVGSVGCSSSPPYGGAAGDRRPGSPKGEVEIIILKNLAELPRGAHLRGISPLDEAEIAAVARRLGLTRVYYWPPTRTAFFLGERHENEAIRVSDTKRS